MAKLIYPEIIDFEDEEEQEYYYDLEYNDFLRYKNNSNNLDYLDFQRPWLEVDRLEIKKD